MSDESSRQVNDGGPAFPTAEVQRSRNVDGGYTVAFKDGAKGMSLRDWMAGQAMAAFISEPVEGQRQDTAQAIAMDPSVAGWFAERAYQMADAMLVARGGGQ